MKKTIDSNKELMIAMARFSELLTLLIEGDHDMDLQLDTPKTGKTGTSINIYG